MKIELYKNTNLLMKFLLLFVIEKTEIKNVDNGEMIYNDKRVYFKYNKMTVVQFKVLFGVKYITRQYYIH